MTTPLFQEALIEAKKLREAAANEAKNAVLEAVSPLIKQMIDKEISGVILEQEEPPAPETAPMDAPPPSPAVPSPDAGATGPVTPAPAGGAEPPPPSLPTMAPATAIGVGAPPIVPAGTPVETKIEADPTTGEPKIVIDVSSIFAPQTPGAAAKTQEVAPPPAPTAELPPAPEAAPGAPAALEEIYRAVQKLLAGQQTPPAPPPAPADPAAAAAAVPPATPPAAPHGAPPAPGTPVSVDATVAGAAATPPQTVPPAVPPVPAGAPVDAAAQQPPATPPPIAPQPNAAAPAAGAVQEYRQFKNKLKQLEESVTLLENGNRSVLAKQSHERAMFSLYESLVGLKNKNAISSRLFASNEGRLDLLHENLNLIYSYTQNPLTKGKTMKKNSLKDFARSLFEGAEGFEKEVGHVDPAGDSEGGSAEHAHHVSGNPKGHKADAEKAPFATKEKSEWPGKPAPTSLLEQLEEEIAEMMSSMEEEETVEEQAEGDDMEEAVFEISDEEVMMEARKARARLKALREQAEEEADMEEGDDDHLSLTIDLDGVSGTEVSNVNVSLDGEELDVDMAGEEGMGEEEEEAAQPEEGEEEVAMMQENKVLRSQLAETQLLTARSLYVNKLFVRDDLSSGQKRKIVEYLDSARTLAEAKEIYNRVVRVLNTAKKNGMVTESVTSRPTQVLAEAAGIVEPSFDTSRWQILAGVKRNAR